MDLCNGTVQQRVEQFDTQHGGDTVNVNGMLIYPDGACRDADPYGQLLDPPSDLYKRSQLIVRFHEEKLKRAVGKFDEMKLLRRRQAEYAVQGRAGCDGPSDEELAELQQLQEKVRACQGRLEEAKKQLDSNTPEWKKCVVPPEYHLQRLDRLSAVEAIKI